jgi:CxxC motif-containing protein (DUF1111 family)
MRRSVILGLVIGLVVLAVIAVGFPATDLGVEAPPGEPLPGLGPQKMARFLAGRVVFEREFTPADGLGPLFNNTGCAACHEVPVTGGSGGFDAEPNEPFRDVETHAAVFDRVAGTCTAFRPGRPVFQQNAVEGEPPGIPPLADVGVGHRTTPALFGMGFIDRIPEARILAHEGRRGGRAHILDDGRIGRFGRKAFTATLAEFTASAFLVEQGVEIPDELSQEDSDLAADFVRFLAIPPRQTDPSSLGGLLFAQIGCTGCHVPKLAPGPALYTDLLLHDMGANMQDLCLGQALPTEFRTAPLIGMRFLERFLHDGRAATIEEAIRLHGGQAEPVIRRFELFPNFFQQQIIQFVEGL